MSNFFLGFETKNFDQKWPFFEFELFETSDWKIGKSKIWTFWTFKGSIISVFRRSFQKRIQILSKSYHFWSKTKNPFSLIWQKFEKWQFFWVLFSADLWLIFWIFAFFWLILRYFGDFWLIFLIFSWFVTDFLIFSWFLIEIPRIYYGFE